MLFDKSFLQSLSVDESVWLDNFFISAICPIFYVETLADLTKSRARNAPGQEVLEIATKFPDMSSVPTPHHWDMVVGELLGEAVPFTGQIPIPHGRRVKSGKHRGYVHEPAPEAEAFQRWQCGEFDEVEREFAHNWRKSLDLLNFESTAENFRKFGISGKTCKSLPEVKVIADMLANHTGEVAEKMKLAILFCYIPAEYHEKILTRWSLSLCPRLSTYAPYTAHVLTAELFFYAAFAAERIQQKPSTRMDIAYLYYLPFCTVFVSSDRLHERCVPLFQRKDQSFIWGEHLKESLSILDKHYSTLPMSEREKGLMHFATCPPTTIDTIVSQLWDKYIPKWRERAKVKPIKPKLAPRFVEMTTKLSDLPSLPADSEHFAPEEADFTTFRRHVRPTKGKWFQLPRDFRIDEDANQS